MYKNDASPFGFAGAKVDIFCGTAKLLSIFLQKKRQQGTKGGRKM
jgi:hypothetical protein